MPGNRAACIAAIVMTLSLAACRPDAPQALGTLEWDRVSLPAPAAEKIVRIDVREGQRVEAGAPLLQLELTRTQSQLAAAQAQAQQSRAALAELQAGPRSEAIAQARASLAAAQAQAADAQAYYARLQPLGRQQLVAAAEVDRARAAAGNTQAQAQADAQAVTLDKLNLVAPRAGRIESLPYKLGDQAPVGAPLAILLVGDAPHARIYVPEPLRAGVQVGDAVRVHVDGRAQAYPGRVRMIRSEPSFTPYYALTGKDAARLSYLAEVELGEEAAQLPAGLPVRAEFGKAARDG